MFLSCPYNVSLVKQTDAQRLSEPKSFLIDKNIDKNIGVENSGSGGALGTELSVSLNFSPKLISLRP